MHGPAGTLSQDVMVLSIEHDPNNDTTEIYGYGGNTQGNWDVGIPIINPEGADRVQFITDYMATYYPMIYAIFPNKIITLVGTVSTTALYNHVALCPTIGFSETSQELITIYYNGWDNLVYSNLQEMARFEIYDLSGKIIFTSTLTNENGLIPVDFLTGGLFLYSVKTNSNVLSGKFIRK
jgi:hypothetical protein